MEDPPGDGSLGDVYTPVDSPDGAPGGALLGDAADSTDGEREEVGEDVGADAADGTQLGTYVNVLKNIIGSGMLAVPFVLSLTGWVAGCVLLAVSGAAALANLYLLIRAADFVRDLGGDAGSYRGLAVAAFGAHAGAIADGVIACYTGSTLVAYGILLVQFLQPALAGAFGDASWAASRWGVLAASAAALVPLCSMRTIEPLRATSLLGNGILAYTAGLVVVRYATGAPPEGGVAQVVLSAGMLQALPSVLFAFNFHYNVHVYYAQLKGRSPRRMLRIVVAAYATVACLYVIIGAAGYCAFGAATRSNIVMSLAAGGASPAVQACQVLLGIMILCTFPVVQYATRSALWRLLGGGAAAGDPALVHRLGLGAATAGGAFVLSSVVPNIGVALALNGALFGVAQQYLIPTACFVVLSKRFAARALPRLRRAAAALFAAGVVVAVLGLVGTIANIVHGSTR